MCRRACQVEYQASELLGRSLYLSRHNDTVRGIAPQALPAIWQYHLPHAEGADTHDPLAYRLESGQCTRSGQDRVARAHRSIRLAVAGRTRARHELPARLAAAERCQPDVQ